MTDIEEEYQCLAEKLQCTKRIEFSASTDGFESHVRNEAAPHRES